MEEAADDLAGPPGQDISGAFVTFPYDRMTVERFRQTFPGARWSDERKSWFVPGKTAARRIDRWFVHEAELVAVYADDKGRDAFAFDSVTGHIGLVPRSSTWTNYRAISKTPEEAAQVYRKMKALESAGAWAVEVEVVKSR